jgi:hypothetical protein
MTINIREATEKDRVLWDKFVDEQGGMFHQYFGWKYVYETSGESLFPLMIEDDQSQLIGTFSLIKENYKLFSIISAFGFKSILFKKGITPDRQYKITSEVIKYIDENYSSRCSTFYINDQLPLGYTEESNQALIDAGFLIRNDQKTGLPCSHILPLEAPFEEKIWKRLWSSKFRQALNKVEKKGVIVIHDQDLKYLDIFADNVITNYKRHKNEPPTKEFLLTAFKVFKDKLKLFVALDQDQPLVLLACIYTPTTCYLWEVGTQGKETDDINKYCYRVAIEDACTKGYQFADFLGAYTAGLSNLKKRYGTQQTPIIVYEKRYSKFRVLMQYVPVMVKHLLFDQKYIWKNRSVIWDGIRRW